MPSSRKGGNKAVILMLHFVKFGQIANDTCTDSTIFICVNSQIHGVLLLAQNLYLNIGIGKFDFGQLVVNSSK